MTNVPPYQGPVGGGPEPVLPGAEEPKQPSVAGFWIGGGLIALAVVGAIAWFVIGFLRLDDAIDDFARVPVSGGEVVLEPGGRVLYLEGRVEPAVAFAPDVQVIGPDGATIPTSPYGGDLTYDFSGRAGTAVLTFEAPTDGTYRLEVQGEPSTTLGSATTLAVGPSVASDLAWAIAGAFLIGGVLGLAGFVLVIVTAIRRSRFRRARQQAYTGPHGQAPWAAPATAAPPHTNMPPPPGTAQPPGPAPQPAPPPPTGRPAPPAGTAPPAGEAPPRTSPEDLPPPPGWPGS